MRQERITKRSRRRTPAQEEPAPVLTLPVTDTAHADEVVAEIDRLLEAV